MNEDSDADSPKPVVGIITLKTYWLLYNFGTFFQHWALRQTLNEWGWRVFRVCEDPFYSSLPLWWRRLCVWRSVLGCRLRGFSLRVALSNFRFFDYRVAPTVRRFATMIGPLVERHPECRHFLIGGDQVWYDAGGYAWGDDLPPASRMIAFAVSADWKFVSENPTWHSCVRKKLSRFAAVAVREKRGVEVLRDLTPASLSVQVAPDPVWLLPLARYQALLPAKPCFSQPTLLAYAVNWWKGEDSYLQELRQSASVHGERLAVLASQGAECLVDDDLRHDCDPVGFLHALRDCTAVVTNSFHGLVFAVLFNKPFVFVAQNDEPGHDQNCRQLELLQTLHLTERMVQVSDLPHCAILRQPLPPSVADKVVELRNNARNILRNMLAKFE